MNTYTETATDSPVQAYNDFHAYKTECFAIIYVTEQLDKQQQASIVDSLTSTPGVDSAHFTPGREHLLVARYNHFQLKTQDIVKQLQQQNLHAVIAGC